MSDNNPIHEAVQEYYSAWARTLDVIQPEAASCCGPAASTASAAEASCGCDSKIYDPAMLEGLPADAVNLSLGCADPISTADLQAGETVLDLGSGGGIDCFMASQRVGPTGYVIGVDMTDDMLAKANANKVKMDARNVEFRKGHIEDLPVRDNAIDVVISNCVINLSPDKSAVFSEIFRVLKPGGRASIGDNLTEGEISDELRADMARWSECMSGALDAQVYIRLMEAAGFVDVEIVDRFGAEEKTETEAEIPHVYSARIMARKPSGS